MFIGTFVHELLQEALKSKAHSAPDVCALLEDILARKTIRQDLLMLEMSEQDLKREVEPFLPHIEFFCQK